MRGFVGRLLMGFCLCLVSDALIAQTVRYVAPNGNDANPGTEDAPFQTLKRARDVLRELKKSGKLPADGAKVLLRGGVYRLDKPLKLLPEDSGTQAGPIVYEAFGEEKPIISGGRVIRGLKKNTDGLYSVIVDAAKDRGWVFRQLFIGGRRYIPARSPNKGHYCIRKAILQGEVATKGQWAGKSKTAFGFFPGNLKAWDNLADVNLKLYFSWNSGLYPLKSIDEKTHVALLAGPTVWPMPRSAGQCYIVENHPGSLDAPGEWQLDRRTGRLTVIPFGDEKISELEVVAPVVEHLLVVKGDADKGRFVEHVKFRGISFRYSAWHLPPTGHGDSQAENTLGATIELDGARNMAIEQCEVTRTGNYGIWFRHGCIGNRIAGNHLHDLGGGGIRIGVHTRPIPKLLSHDNLVDNNFIHDGGHIHAGAVGICVGYAHNNTISHNEVSDFRYTGISLGWTWSITRSGTRENIVEHNHVHHVVRVLDDGGGIYSLGLTPGSVIRNNHIHHVGRQADGVGHGIYLDGGGSGVLAENNLIHDTGMGGIRIQHGNSCQTVLNNICAYCGFGLGIDSERTNIFAYNIVYLTGDCTPFRPVEQWKSYNKIIKHNLYWHEDGKPIKFLKYSFDEWQKLEGIEDVYVHYTPRMDKGSRIADPKFVDAKGRDFRLKPDSPAFALGFRKIDMENNGLYGSHAWKELPASYPMRPLLPTETRLRKLFHEDGFELDAPGDKPGLVKIVEAEKGFVTISDERAATGKNSLKFVDSAELKQGNLPHIFYCPNLHENSNIRLEFDLYREPGAMLYVEWRDYVGPRQIGPDIRIDADGRLLLNRKPTEYNIPAGTWVHFEMTDGLGTLADGLWSMKITVKGKVLLDRKDLVCDPGFASVEWLGFVSYGTKPTVFYLDNVSFKKVQPPGSGR